MNVSARLRPGPWRMPAEWEPHERCLVAWPARSDLWGDQWDAAKREYAATIAAISAFEPVTVIAHPGSAAQVRAAVPAVAEIVEIPIDDSWARDSGPIITVDAGGNRSGADFGFNSWGEKYAPWDADAASAALILDHLGIQRRASPMILEGGAITVDGEGTLITTEQCLLNPNRNPDMSREQIEAELATMLGISTVVWLPVGLADDTDTDGHVDGVATFARPGVVVVQTCPDPHRPDHDRLQRNLDTLRSATDARGRRFEVIEVPQMPFVTVADTGLGACYVNFYVANGGVVVSTVDHPDDADALDILRGAFPGREVVGVPSAVIGYGGGGTHCITQQIPLAP